MRSIARLAGVGVLTLSLTACAMFAPAYDPILDQQATSAYQGISVLTAQAELGSYKDPASFAGASSQYANVTASLNVAALRASTEPVYSKGTAVKARDLLVSLINGCKAQVMSMAGLHQAAGLVPGSGVTQPVMVACDQAARAARAMKTN